MLPRSNRDTESLKAKLQAQADEEKKQLLDKSVQETKVGIKTKSK